MLSKYAQAAATLVKRADAEMKKDTANVPRQADYTNLAKGALVAGQLVGPVSQSILHWDNKHVPQNNELGQVFGNFIADKINRPYVDIMVKDAPHRTVEEYLSATKLPQAFAPFTPLDAGFEVLSAPTAEESAAMAEDVLQPFIHGTIYEGNKFQPNLPGTDAPALADKMLDNLDAARKAVIESGKFDKDLAQLIAPRNNMTSIAHEAGHASNLYGMSDLLSDYLPEKFVQPAYDAFEVAAAPAFSTLEKAPGVGRAFKEFRANSGLAKPFIDAALSGALPGYLTTALAGSQTLRDALRYIPGGNTAMDFVEDHPVATAVSGFVPQMLDEMYTSIPGSKYTEQFYEHLNALKGKPLTPDLAEGLGSDIISRLGTFSPKLEALKFLGKNTLANLTYAMAPITAAAAAYLLNKKD